MTYKKEIIHIQYVIKVAYNTINAKAVKYNKNNKLLHPEMSER